MSIRRSKRKQAQDDEAVRKALESPRKRQVKGADSIMNRLAALQEQENADGEDLEDDYFTQRARRTESNAVDIAEQQLVSSKTRFTTLRSFSRPWKSLEENLEKKNKKKFISWFRLLHNGFNVLLFGVGSKADLLEEFSATCLMQFCRVTVRGFQPSVCVRSVLSSIAREVLEISAIRDNYRLALSIVAKLQESCKDIYIIFHNIDGPSFRNAEAQDVIAILAESPRVHLIASIDHVRAPLLWDSSRLEKLRFAWMETHTFANSLEEAVNQEPIVGKRYRLQAQGIRNVLQSLTKRHSNILSVLATIQLEQPEHLGLTFEEYYDECLSEMLVKNDPELRRELQELIDHELIVKVRGLDTFTRYHIPLPEEEIRAHILQQL